MKIYVVYVLYHYGVFEWQDLVDLVKISKKYIVNEDLCSRCTILLWCIWMAGFFFFFFFMGNTNKLCWILEASNTSCRRAWSRKLGLSSTQIEKSLMPSAYLYLYLYIYIYIYIKAEASTRCCHVRQKAYLKYRTVQWVRHLFRQTRTYH